MPRIAREYADEVERMAAGLWGLFLLTQGLLKRTQLKQMTFFLNLKGLWYSHVTCDEQVYL